jgi:hypothetical protein
VFAEGKEELEVVGLKFEEHCVLLLYVDLLSCPNSHIYHGVRRKIEHLAHLSAKRRKTLRHQLDLDDISLVCLLLGCMTCKESMQLSKNRSGENILRGYDSAKMVTQSFTSLLDDSRCQNECGMGQLRVRRVRVRSHVNDVDCFGAFGGIHAEVM